VPSISATFDTSARIATAFPPERSMKVAVSRAVLSRSVFDSDACGLHAPVMALVQWVFFDTRAIKSSILERNSFRIGDVFILL
jgi:hypothetical protein